MLRAVKISEPILAKKLVMFLFAAGIFFAGCTPSSGNLRFEDKPRGDAPPDSQPKTRFEQTPQPDYTPVTDTASAAAADDEEDRYYYLPAEDKDKIFSRFEQENKKLEADFSNASEKVMIEIVRMLNTPYKWGGNSKEDGGVDCSGFTCWVYKHALKFNLHRTARDQFTQGEPVDGLENLKFGDLVFFDTRRGARPGHVGIYIGDGLFAHSSTKEGVIISSFETKYYIDRYMGARRFPDLMSDSGGRKK